MTPEPECAVCCLRLEHARTGRPRVYCSRRCKKAAERKRRRFAPFRPRPKCVSPAPALVRALKAVQKAERQLAEARAAREALERAALDPLDPPHEYRPHRSFEEYRAAQGGGLLNPGIDVGEVATAIRRQYDGTSS